MAAVTICSDFGATQNKVSLFPLFPHLLAMKWWDQMPWSSFFECWVLSQLFHSPLPLSSRGSLFPLVAESKEEPKSLLRKDLLCIMGFLGGSEVKAYACNAGDVCSIPGSGRSPGEGNGHPLQYSCLENPMDGGAWQATVHGVVKSRTWLSDFTFTFHSASWNQVPSLHGK